jgi:hypothetical protein
MVNLNDIASLMKELETTARNFIEFHSKMRQQLDYYHYSAFYSFMSGQVDPRTAAHANLLKLFADKNIEYTAPFPKMKVPTPGADQETRYNASIREKIILGAWKKSNGAALQRKFAFDGTIRSVAVAETVKDLKNRCVYVRRHAPQKCFWQLSDDGGELRVVAFWAVRAITKDEAMNRYGVTPKNDAMTNIVGRDDTFKHIDGREWFTEAWRWDGQTRVHWVGDQFVEKPHNHGFDGIPIDVCMPFESGDDDTHFPAFYLDPLVPLQAELNDTIFRRGRIVRRMSSPVAWVRGMMARKADDLEDVLKRPGGGLVPLTKDGEMGLLQVNDTSMLDNHEADIILQMMRLSGYGNAAFGEPIGANTSGDAIGMYFNATQRKIETQNIAWTQFWESINAKILRAYEQMALGDEEFRISGFAPHGTVLAMEDGTYKRVSSGIYSDIFTAENIAGNYSSVAEPVTAAPKNQLELMRIAVDAVDRKVISRTTGYEQYGLDSPEDEFALLEQEQSSPIINPDGVQKLLQANQPPAANALPSATPAPIGAGNGPTIGN